MNHILSKSRNFELHFCHGHLAAAAGCKTKPEVGILSYMFGDGGVADVRFVVGELAEAGSIEYAHIETIVDADRELNNSRD